jgi:hypothetical protein
LCVEGEERAAVEEKEGEAEEKEHALEVALATVAENDHHPEKHEKCSGSKDDEAEIEEELHWRASIEFYRWS